MAILENHFYHKTIRLYTAVFGECFNNITVQRDNGQTIKVPIAYAAQQRYNVLENQREDQDVVRYMKRTPRMSFVLRAWARDPVRVKNKYQRLSNRHAVADITTSPIVTGKRRQSEL